MTKKENRFKSTGGGQSASTSNTKFNVPNPGLEDVRFTHRAIMAAVEFYEK